MKKILAIVLVCILTLSFVACGGGDESSTDTSKAGTASTATSTPADDSSADDSSDDASSEASSDASSDASSTSSDVTSDDSSDTTSDPNGTDEPAVVFGNKFICWKNAYYDGGIVGVKNTDSTSLRISNLNEDDVLPGAIAVFTHSYGTYLPVHEDDFADFAIVVFEYKHDVNSYVIASFSKVGEGDPDTEIPEDGYVAVIHKDFQDKIDAIEATASNTVFYPVGFCVNEGLWTTIKEGSVKVDGKISTSEYGAPIWEMNEDNELVSFAQFKGDIYAEADVYLTYDEDYLYLGVVVSSPYHTNTLVEGGDLDPMYNHECIQVNVSSHAANSDYMNEHADYSNDKAAVEQNVVRQYGFCVNDDGVSLKTTWFNATEQDNSIVCCIRDDAAQKTYYEVAIPWSDCGAEGETIVPEKGTEFGFAVSINSGDGSTFKNITLRDGGGIIGINDWSKVPVIELG